MKLLRYASLVALMSSAPLHAQSLTVNGVNLSLGESETKARADIARAGMDIQKMLANSYTLRAKRGDTYDMVGQVTFENGGIAWVQRDWYLSETPDDKNILANVFYGAVSSLLEGRTQESCTVTVKTEDHSPSSGVLKVTTIECGAPKRIHTLALVATDCSSGCSIGKIVGTLVESIRMPN